MTTLIASRRRTGYHHYRQAEPLSIVQLLVSWLMSETRHTRFQFDPLKNPSESFLDYLEGYASAFDLYPVCSRHLFRHRDMGLLVDEFWQIAHDLSQEAEAARRAGIGVSEEGPYDIETREGARASVTGDESAG